MVLNALPSNYLFNRHGLSRITPTSWTSKRGSSAQVAKHKQAALRNEDEDVVQLNLMIWLFFRHSLREFCIVTNRATEDGLVLRP
ncbi:hypothetical protein AC579_4453 [Pseudocercospora musae]|uniref:Uncharacterized protein n=1 Tax=Pseudocercospora musae TaxID=113226 RepID=A0A139GT84_9PEZI|nr:hypothetical protein AC579_4453 [Pseudocercospora musae]